MAQNQHGRHQKRATPKGASCIQGRKDASGLKGAQPNGRLGKRTGPGRRLGTRQGEEAGAGLGASQTIRGSGVEGATHPCPPV